MSEPRLLEIGRSIANRVEKRMRSLGINREVLSAYLHQEWGVTVGTTKSYLRYLFRGAGFEQLNKAGRNPYYQPNLNKHEQRISDLLAALNVRNEEALTILEGMQEIQPDFKIVDSRVEPYSKSNPVISN